MELQQVAALTVFVAVYVVSSSRWVHRAAAAVAGAVVLAVFVGVPSLVGALVPDVVLVSAGLMVLAGYIKKAGIASWLALKAAKAARGRPRRILVLTGLVTWVAGALVGPVAAVVLVVPVALLLAVELDVPPLPFVVVLSWTSLVGGTATLTAQPGNLWVGAAFHINGAAWAAHLAPYSLAALVVTLALGVVVFGKRLRVTNERRARVLEYDESQTLGDRPLLVKTLVALGLVVVGLVAGPLVGLAPSVVTVGGAVLLWLADPSRNNDRILSELEGGTLLFFGALMAVVGAVAASGLPQAWASNLPGDPLVVLWCSALFGSLVDHGAAAGALVPLIQGWAAQGNAVWPAIILGTSLGAGVTVLGSVANTTALGLAGQGPGKPTWRDFSLYGLGFAVANLVVVSLLFLVLGR